MSVQGLLIFIVLALCVVVVTWLVSQDARRRGLREPRVLLAALASVFLFPIGLLAYLLLRPSARR